ncbi:MAG: sodium/proton-translocating pyrophosphatase, partial [Candidatus Hodarchaeales archaeon]
MFTTFLELNPIEQATLGVVIVVAIISFIYSWWLRKDVLSHDKGSEEMQQVWEAINEGANAYLKRQLMTILPIVLILTVALFFSVYLIEPTEAA